MKGKRMPTVGIIMGVLAFLGGWAISAQDKYTVKVPNLRSLKPKHTRSRSEALLPR
jgi:hypothetical protein